CVKDAYGGGLDSW
nr:immunoglobulin heavy chain junction region [Macaca mulatta]MOW78866.1 immunoglobulin heavy chain junction region [Macaca mulatta]MOW80420.1 immunoglobulin heavy chain junction region [Macaca mulatta]MOW81299.1 immunoglobulin heavy chain junction region [Macaca mulatta]MOW81371.1 immunoglobulin heavy chain junction region [Macaca mulatta]